MLKVSFPVRPDKSPKIYGYTQPTEEHKGLIKVGYTDRNVIERVLIMNQAIDNEAISFSTRFDFNILYN